MGTMTLKEILNDLKEEERGVVEAHCEKCNRYIPIAIKYLEYTRIAKKAVPYPIILNNNKCPNCKMTDSMTIPSFA
jgi:hypothetical protein